MTRRDRLRKVLRDTVEDTVSNLLYYDRKEDESLSRDDVQEMFTERWITNAELVQWFSEALRRVNDEGSPSGGEDPKG